MILKKNHKIRKVSRKCWLTIYRTWLIWALFLEGWLTFSKMRWWLTLARMKVYLCKWDGSPLSGGWLAFVKRTTGLCQEHYSTLQKDDSALSGESLAIAMRNISPLSGGLLAFVRRITRLCHEDYSTLSGGWLVVRRINRFCQKDYSPLSGRSFIFVRRILAFARRITRICQEDYLRLSGG